MTSYTAVPGIDVSSRVTQDGAQDLKFKFNIGTEELREIIGILNRKPFELNFTLVSFDELGANDALELVNSIFAKLEKKNDVKLKEEGSEKTLERFIEFLRILSYPGRFDEETIKSFMNGDKKVLQPIIYFCLANFDSLIKRAYLGKFLVPIVIPDEHLVDEEMKTSYNDYMSLLEEFKENHRVYDEKMKGASNPQTLKKEIGQLEHEKDQLNNRIKEFREKYDKKADFQDLLKEITMMRKEQEEESNLVDKLRQQKRLLDKCDNDLLMSQQKLIDTKRAVGDESSSEEMLYALKSDVARTKNKITEIQFEVREKRKKLAENDSKLYDPLPPADQIEGMKNKVSALRNIVSDLSRKLEREKSPEKEDKLFIQKQQEQMVKNQKEKVENEMKKLEVEKTDLEEKIREKTKDLEKLKGPGYAKKTEIGKYQDRYNEKKSKQMKFEQELNELRAENETLRETLAVLHDEKNRTDKRVKHYERKHGVEGLSKMITGVNEFIEKNEQIDAIKGKSLLEMSAIVQQLSQKIEDLKTTIQPQVQEHKNLKNQMAQLEPTYREEKQKFDHITADAKSSLDEAREVYQKEKNEVYENDSKADILTHQIKVIKTFQDMLDKEADYQEGKKILNNTHKSYKNWMQADLAKYDNLKTELKQKRDFIKKNYDQSVKQIGYLKQMEFLLQEKLKLKRTGKEERLRGTEQRKGQMDILIMNE